MIPFPIFFLALLTFNGKLGETAIADFLKEDFFCIYTHTALVARNVTYEAVQPEKITFYVFTDKTNPDKYVQFGTTNASEAVKPLVESGKKLVFIIHGWTSNRESEWYEDMKNAFLARHGYHVIQVDWSEPANQLYTVSSYNTKEVGQIIGRMIVDLSLPLDKILLVGHSLGGQVTGFIGKTIANLTSTKLPRIVALDPAGPLFWTRPPTERLNNTDADVVEVIHTDGGTFGFNAPCGTLDFFPNGGSSQPGCAVIDLLDIKSIAEPVMCAHHRSWAYFIEALLNPKAFTATKCSSWLKYKALEKTAGLDTCEGEVVNLGDLATRVKGLFYLETNGDKPYAKKEGNGLGLSKLLKHF